MEVKRRQFKHGRMCSALNDALSEVAKEGSLTWWWASLSMTFRNDYKFGMGSGGCIHFEESGSGVKEQYFREEARAMKGVCVFVCACTYVCLHVNVHFKDRHSSKYVKEREQDTCSTDSN